jgi:hypothetical protein
VLRAVRARSRLVLAAHPSKPHADAFWLVGGRVADWGPLPAAAELAERTRAALAQSPLPGPGALVPAEEVDEVRLVAAWLARHPETAALDLDPVPGEDELAAFAAATELRPGEPAASRRPSRSRSRVRRPAGRARARLPR